MKAGIVFAGSGPILILTSYDSFEDPNLLAKLATKGMDRFIVWEVDLALAKEKYGQHFDIIMKDVKQTDDLRILDYNGYNIMHSFSFKRDTSPPLIYEP